MLRLKQFRLRILHWFACSRYEYFIYPPFWLLMFWRGKWLLHTEPDIYWSHWFLPTKVHCDHWFLTTALSAWEEITLATAWFITIPSQHCFLTDVKYETFWEYQRSLLTSILSHSTYPIVKVTKIQLGTFRGDDFLVFILSDWHCAENFRYSH